MTDAQAQAAISIHHAYTAMCIWEAILEDPDGPWAAFRRYLGTATLRDEALTLAPDCDADWERLGDEGQALFDTFDWDFVPAWLRDRVTWGGAFALRKGSPKGFADWVASRRNALTHQPQETE